MVGYEEFIREIYKRLEGEMADTLERYRELLEINKRLKDEFNAIKLEYPKYKPKKVKTQYDKLKLDLMNCLDEMKMCNNLMLLGIPLDEFNRVYSQAKSEVLDILSRYETDSVLNVLLADHTILAYIRCCRRTKELTYNVDILYLDDKELPTNKTTDYYFETSLIDYYLRPYTLQELHSKWKEDKPVEADLYRNFRDGTRNYTTVRIPCKILSDIAYGLYKMGDLLVPVFTYIETEESNLIFN